MKYGFITTNFSSKDFLSMAIKCRHNSRVLKDSAKLVFENEASRNHGIFLLHSSSEELQKAVFCMFVHRGFMEPGQIIPVFSKHESKIILFEKIFENPSFVIRDGTFWIDGRPLKSLNLDSIIEENEKNSKKYMEKRNDSLYVKPIDGGTSLDPSETIEEFEERRESIMNEMSYLDNFLQIIWSNDFQGNLDDFSYYTLTPKDKPKTYNITFSGTGFVTEREKYKLEDLD